MEEVRHPTLGIGVERDIYFDPSYSMSVYHKAARKCQQITDEPDQLAIVARSLVSLIHEFSLKIGI